VGAAGALTFWFPLLLGRAGKWSERNGFVVFHSSVAVEVASLKRLLFFFISVAIGLALVAV
jgi:hypothetical protein